jgi:hypothetical protein
MNRITAMQYLAAISLLAVFIVNISTPLVFNIDILYLCSIVLVFKQSTKTILCFSVAACALIIIHTLLFDASTKRSILLWTNRLISLFAIFITSYIAIHYRKQTQVGALKQQRHVKVVETMLFMMSHQVRKPVANILGLIETADVNSGDLSTAETAELCRLLIKHRRLNWIPSLRP